MLTRSQIQREEKISREHQRRINDTFGRRRESDAAWDAWKDACHQWHKKEMLCFYLWSQDARKRMVSGEREVIEDALLFLEVDPWFFRSGYLKERVLRHLKSAALTERDRARLRNVIDSVTQGPSRRELRDYCRLALKVWAPEWEAQLRDRAERINSGGKHNPLSGNKLTYLLSFLDAHRHQLPQT